MYYEETIIKGVLHYKLTPNGEWIPMDATRLTLLLQEARKTITILHNHIQEVNETYHVYPN